MKTKIKRWVTLGVGTALLGTGLAACEAIENTTEGHAVGQEDHSANPTGETHETHPAENSAGELGENGEGEGGEVGHDMETLALPERLAFMTGHVEAGLALYRAGAPETAAPHLLHPVSETHESERAGLDKLGFDASLFEVVSKALEAGKPAAEIEPQLVAAEENLAMVAQKAGGDPNEIIRFLMATVVEEYTIAITDGVVTDMGEYQDAYGFSIVAKDRAEAMETRNQALINEIDALIALWPDAPIPPENPTPVEQVVAHTSKVLLAIPAS